jgi:hypothetical protein
MARIRRAIGAGSLAADLLELRERAGRLSGGEAIEKSA